MEKKTSNGNETGDYRAMAMAMVAAGLFGVSYNAAVAWLERRGYAEGYVSLLVVVGNGVLLLLALPLLGLRAVGVMFGLFAAGGSSMIIGSVYRYMQAREAAADWLDVTARGNGYGYKTERMADARQRGSRPG